MLEEAMDRPSGALVRQCFRRSDAWTLRRYSMHNGACTGRVPSSALTANRCIALFSGNGTLTVTAFYGVIALGLFASGRNSLEIFR